MAERIAEVIETQKEHEKRITQLEINDATVNQQLITLFKKLDDLTGWIKALVLLGTTSLLGFFFWYIQGLGK